MTERELLDFLGNQPNNELTLHDLASQVASGTGVIPFVGAGMSAPHLPQWGKFLKDAAGRARLEREVEELLNDDQYEEAAELLHVRTASDFQSMMERSFGDEAVAAIIPRGAVTWIPRVATNLVITTNFDRLLEKVFLDAGCPFPVAKPDNKISVVLRAVRGKQPYLLKLHGDWEFAEQRVFDKSEYAEQYGKSKKKIDLRKAIPRVLGMLVTRPLLFLGCSLKQDRVGLVLRELGKKNPTENFVILQYPGDKEYEQRIADLHQMGVRPVWYQTHDQITQVLIYLAERVPETLRLVKQKPEPKPDRIPRHLSTFIGRETEKSDLRARIVKYSLVTVVGGPGTGKTRLTIEAVRALLEEFDSIWYAPLSQIAGVAALPQRVANVMNVKESGGNLLDDIAAALKPGRQMLVLDNCETILAECIVAVRELRGSCPDLHLVLTSRIELGKALPGGAEHLYRVPAMALPDPEKLPPTNELREIDSVKLLLDRLGDPDSLRLTDANARDVAKLCQGLDGVPLALELVAAQIGMRSLSWVLEQWEHRLDFEGEVDIAEAEPQTTTLNQSIAVSYKLLGNEPNGERLCRLFHALSVFHRGWFAGAAHAVCAEGNETENSVVKLLAPLHQASLIEVEEVAGEKRYRYVDAIREFATKGLMPPAKADELRARMAQWAMAFAEKMAPALLTDKQRDALAKMVGEADNLRAAMDWADERKDANAALRLSAATWRVMEIKGFYARGITRAKNALEMPGAKAWPDVRSKVLSGWSTLAYRLSDLNAAERCAKESLALEKTSGSEGGMANAYNDLGNVEMARGKAVEALDLYSKSLDHYSKTQPLDERGIAVARFNCGRLEMHRNRLKEAADHLHESQKMFKASGNRREEAFALNTLGVLSRLLGRTQEALLFADDSLKIREDLGDQRGVAEALRTKSAALIVLQDFEGVPALLRESGKLACKIGDDRGVAETLEHLAWLSSAHEQHGVTSQLYAVAKKLRNDKNLPLPDIDKRDVDGRLDAARRALGDAGYAAQWDKGTVTSPEKALALDSESTSKERPHKVANE